MTDALEDAIFDSDISELEELEWKFQNEYWNSLEKESSKRWKSKQEVKND
jgi:hypothetical protein